MGKVQTAVQQRGSQECQSLVGGHQAVQNAGSLRILASQAIVTSRMLPKPRPNQRLLFESLKAFHSFKRTESYFDKRIGGFLYSSFYAQCIHGFLHVFAQFIAWSCESVQSP